MKKRITALLLAVVSILSMLTAPASAAAPDTIKMDDCAYSGTKYDSPALGECYMHQMHFALNGKSTMGFCAEKGKGMGWSLKGHTWGNPKPISDPTVKTMMAYFYAHSTGVFTDQAKALGVDDVWDSNYTWTMNSWTQAVVWRYKAGLLSDPVVACAEELLCVYNNLEHTSYTSIDDTMDGRSFRDRAQYILDLGAQGVWGECSVYEYAYTGPGSNYHPANDVQAVMVGELNITRQKYELTVKKVDSTNPNKGLAGARFLVSSENGAFSKEIVTGQDGTYTLTALDAGTYAVTELEAPEGYEIDNAGPQYVVLPSNGNNTVTVTFADTPTITGEGSIRKVDADDPTKGLAGAVIPPLTQILGVVIEALKPIVSIATEFVQALLPAVEPLISAIGTVLSGVVLPVLEALSPVLSFAADVLGTIAGWVSDLIGFFANGVSKVASFFSGIFGGAKESSEAVDGLTGSVNGLDEATSSETSLAVDTSEYSSNISEASKAAEQAVTDATNAAREISNENYGLMADDAETAYARMTLDAESAWDRMTTAAENGAAKIVASFGKIASAAQSVNSANISVSGVSIPGNAEGTDNWRGGWTRMNEEGGELAYLPSGTAIIPADKTDEIINNSTSTESSYTDSSTFSPHISISLGGGGDGVDVDGLDSHILELLEKWYREKKEDEYHNRAMQGAYARS